jgi:hypothetical protein
MRKTFLLVTLCSVAATSVVPALAQRSSDPNFNHFYMARQQITITDDGPVVNDQRTNPQAGGAGGGVGGMAGGPPALPKAGWQPYSSSIPSVRTGLPQVVNGVPPKAPPPGPSGMSGRAGALKAKKGASAAAPRTPSNVVQTYNAYKGYGGNLSPASTGGGGGGTASYSTNTNVQGSVLHWARKKRSY